MLVLKNTEWAQSFTPFEDDVAEIERIWGEPLPEHLMFVGGLDWPAWGHFYYDPSDPPGLIRGEARDRAHLYQGLYQLLDPNGLARQDIQLEAFEVSGMDGSRVILHRRDQPPPVDYVYLMPHAPEAVRTP